MEIARIALDGRIKADLSWEHEREAAKNHVKQGYMLLWEIDLGLFSQLPLPLTNHSQYLSLGISLDHFRKDIWSEFGEDSLGVSYYGGNADFINEIQLDLQQEEAFRIWLRELYHGIQAFVSDTQIIVKSFDDIKIDQCKKSTQGRHLLSLYCRDVAADYFLHLSTHLSAHIPAYLLLDISHVASPLLQAQLINQERYNHFRLAVKGCRWAFSGLIWHDEKIISKSSDRSVPVGVCLPSSKVYRPEMYFEMESALQQLLDKKIHFRVIPESMIVIEWEGLDYLIYEPTALTVQGRRQLHGFAAAGGTVVSLGLAREREIGFKDFFKDITDIKIRTRKAFENLIKHKF